MLNKFKAQINSKVEETKRQMAAKKEQKLAND